MNRPLIFCCQVSQPQANRPLPPLQCSMIGEETGNTMNSSSQENSRTSILKMTAAMMIFGTVGIFRRVIPLSSALLSCLRGLTGALFLFLYVRMRRHTISPPADAKAKLSFIVSGCLIGLNWMFLFEAYRFTSVPVATLCYYTQPVIVILLSPLLFHEKLTVRKILCIIFAAAGMGLVTGIHPEGNSLRGILYGLAAACLYAGVVIFNKKAPPADAYEKTILQLFSAGMVMVPYLLFTDGFKMPAMDLRTAVLTAVVCLVHTGIAYLFYFDSMKELRAQTIAVMGYIDPVSALLLSAVILQEPLTPLSFLGAAMIITAALTAELSER